MNEPAKAPESAEKFLAPWRPLYALRFAALAAAGYGYVSHVMCGRPPFSSAPEGSWELLKLIALIMLLLPLLNGWIARSWTWPAPDLRRGLICFFLTLHFQWIPRYTNIDFALNSSLLHGGMALPVLGALILVAAGLGYAVSRHVHEARRRGHLRMYLALLIAVVMIPALITFALRGSHSLHVHHYALGIMLMLLARYPTPLSGGLFGLAFGLLIEGAARWGLDPCWIAR